MDRKTVYDTQYLKVFEDKVELPDGQIKEKYSVVQFPNVVVIVATDRDGNIITLDEYKCGLDAVTRVFPAGHIKDNEGNIEAAKRELLEETGYGDGEFEYIGKAIEFPTKQLGLVYVVRAKNVSKISDQNLDQDEAVEVKLITIEELEKEVKENKWQTSSSLCALVLTGVLNP